MKKFKQLIDQHEDWLIRFGAAASAIVLLLGAIALGFGFGDKGERTLAYSEDGSSVSYNVYLLPNNTYPDSYIVGSADRSYPTSLIDYLDLNFNYKVKFAGHVEGDLTYKLVALSSADKADGSTTANLWSEEHNIIAPQTTHIDGDSFTVSQNTKITYDTYAIILKNFEAEAKGVVAKGSLNVALVIEGDLKPSNFVDPANFNSRIDFTIPIAANSSVEAKTNTRGNSTMLSEIPARLDALHIIIVILGLLLVLSGVCLLVGYIMAKKHKMDAHPYEENIRKLLSAYDGIIVELSHAPVFKNSAVSDVEEFDELLDVYNSVHLPINYYKSKHASYFVIIGEKSSWRYIVSESDYKKHGKKN